MKQLLLVIVASIFFLSCNEFNKGTIHLANNSTDPYSIYIDGQYKTTLHANTYTEYRLIEGPHSVEVKQNSGYLFWPTEKTYNVVVEAMKNIEYVLP